jgi:hypothetical protein
METVWDQLYTRWNDEWDWVDRDWVHFFSGNNLTPGDGFTNALAKGSICSFPTGLDPNFVTTAIGISDVNTTFSTLAHELGHGFDLDEDCKAAEDFPNDTCSQNFIECTIMMSGCSNPNLDCDGKRLTCFSQFPCGTSYYVQTFGDCYGQTTHFPLCKFLNQDNLVTGLPQNACLIDPPPLFYGTANLDFEILLEDEQGVLVDDDLLCVGEEMEVSFYNTFLNTYSNYEITWTLGFGLTLVQGTIHDRVIIVEGAGNYFSQICVSFTYNGHALNFCRDVQVGYPLPPGSPIMQYVTQYPSPPAFNIGFHESPFATFYNYSYNITGGTNGGGSANGSTADPTHLVSLQPYQCATIYIYAGNDCGVNPNTPYDPLTHCFNNPLMAPDDNGKADIANDTKLKPGESGATLKDKSGNAGNQASVFQLFPNPTGGDFTVVGPAFEETSEFRVFDAAGRLVLKMRWERFPGQALVGAAHLPGGIYKARLIQGANHFSSKLEILK